MEHRRFIVPVRFTGKIEYEVYAETPEEASGIAERLACEEARLGDLEDVEWETKPPIDC